MQRIPFERINWPTSLFLLGTLGVAFTAVPLYIWKFGLDWFHVAMFFILFAATSMSITLGYHRLFSHRTFNAHWSIRLFTLLFGAATFENSALLWSSEHRRHHKHVDHDEDPYDITKGFFWAHMGWLLFKIDPPAPFDNVVDLQKDKMVMWQHRYIHQIAVVVSVIFPTVLGAICGYFFDGGAIAQGALGGFLIGGVARIVAVQHSTFCINSLCHTIGSRPYSKRCSARDSLLMAILTFGEGYHNYHHEFPNDYRNGVKPWQFDPTKWAIWLMSKVGLTSKLRQVPAERIAAAERRVREAELEARSAAAARAARDEDDADSIAAAAVALRDGK